MKTVYEHTMYSGLGALAFLEQHAARFPTLVASTERRVLEDAVPRIRAYSIDQTRLGLELAGQFKRQKWLERKLRSEHLAPIADFAREMMTTTPSCKALAISLAHVKGQALLNVAYSMASIARDYWDDMRRIGFPPGTLADLDAITEDLRATIERRGNMKAQRVGATSGITHEAQRIVASLRTLSGVMEHLIPDDAPLMAAWRKARGLPQLS